MKNFLSIFAFLVFAFVIAPNSSAWAVDQMDVSVGLKTLPLMNNKISGSAAMAVIFDPANPASKAEADEVKALIDAGLEAPGGIKISALMVPSTDLSKLSGAKIGFVAKGACTDAVSAAAASNGILTMTTELDCVKSSKCILGVVSKPRVEIFYSKSAADAAKIGFSQAFSMLVSQV